MGIARNPTMYNTRKTAADMTWLKLHGQQIFKGRRQAGQSNPSPEFLFSQKVAEALWRVFRKAKAAIVGGWTSKLLKQPAASVWYKDNYANAIENLAGDALVEVDALAFSKGIMTATPVTITSNTMAQTVTATWDPTPADSTQLATDYFGIVVVIGNATNDPNADPPVFMEFGDASRADGTSTITLPDPSFATGWHINAYTFFAGAPATANAGTSETNTYTDHVAS